ncbi:glucan-binding YG repeat protein [Clostridium beijerinckii]|uniref:glycoside hydrolase family 3 protein n=1 Tax=Clostridium beijerinckii TaxID=1520 RepID=UPI001812E7BB|nr:glycoside hydrolase family 3 protein [Clostridium beijerinckii]NYC51648.1 glucan-binding YG repeat protein [Clostridium beijerinckii]
MKKNKNNPYKDYLAPYSLPDYNLTDDDIEASSNADTAIYVISRMSGEGTDRTGKKGDYYLTDEEYANIKKMAESFKNSIVLLNVGGIIDTKFAREIPELDSVLLMSQAGMESGTAAVKVLNGEVTPSGKLTDTWAENYSDYPSSKTFSSNDKNTDQEDYKEDIYVGYRYFDSFNVKPAYEFGYGLSYTTFNMNVVSVEADEKHVTVKVNVKNTGNYSGKEVAQVYFSAPSGKLDKPYQELAGYGKTDLLAPGQSQTITISYDTSEMSSYSEDDAAYIMEKGNYIIRVGNSSRNTHVGAVLTLDETVTTEQLSNQMKTDKSVQALSDKGVTPYSYAEEGNEIANAQKIQLYSQALDLIDGNNESKYDDETVTTYIANDAGKKETTTDAAANYKDVETDETIDENKNSTLDNVSNDMNIEKFLYVDNVDDTSAFKYDDNGAAIFDVSNSDEAQSKSIMENKTLKNSVDNIETPSYKEIRENIDVKKDATLYDVYNKDITMEQFVAGLSTEKLANIVNGIGTAVSQTPVVGAQSNAVAGGAGETTGDYYETDGIPNIVLADGPAGLRLTKQYDKDGKTWYQYATAWPIGTLLAQTWDLDLMEEVHNAIGDEMVEFGVTLWLAPGMNIHRDPFCGRNFEYYSEDPFITGTMGLAATKGVQSHLGIGVTIKHFAANNQENNRNLVNETISERALREIYLKGFEMAIKGGQPMSIMTAFNKINGVFAGANYDLVTDIARGEWKFDGVVMTDWYSKAKPDESMHSGNDLIMPGATQDAIIKAVFDYIPAFNEDGYVASKTVYDYYGKGTSVEQWNDFTPSSDGDTTISTIVKKGIPLNDKVIEMINDGKASVEFAKSDAETTIETSFDNVQALLNTAASTDDTTTSPAGDETASTDDTTTSPAGDETASTDNTTTSPAGDETASTDDTTTSPAGDETASTGDTTTSPVGDETAPIGDTTTQPTEEQPEIIHPAEIATTTDAAVEVTLDPMTDTSRDRIVTYYGKYVDNNTIYLGDLQKSAMNVLNIIMQSTQFEKMYKDKGVKAKSYTEKYNDLKNYMTFDKGEITKDENGSGNNGSSGSSSHHHSSGSYSTSGDTSTTSNSNNANSNNTTAKNKWSKNLDGTWSFVNSNGEKATGWVQDGNSWYHLDQSGNMQTGWLKDADGSWYYLNNNGAMTTGWFKDTDGNWYYLDNNGAMKTGWLKDANEKWYYLNTNGEMAVDTVIDGYTIDSSGSWLS